jgi:hypothetical protein
LTAGANDSLAATAAIMLRERVGMYRWIATLGGFLGVPHRALGRL